MNARFQIKRFFSLALQFKLRISTPKVYELFGSRFIFFCHLLPPNFDAIFRPLKSAERLALLFSFFFHYILTPRRIYIYMENLMLKFMLLRKKKKKKNTQPTRKFLLQQRAEAFYEKGSRIYYERDLNLCKRLRIFNVLA